MNIILNIKSLYKSYNNGKDYVINNINLSLEKGKILAVVGESGSGKTTLIRLISGLETPDEGIITLNQKTVNSDTVFIRPEKRNIGMVFQDYALFPHLTVFENVVYGISKTINKEKRVNEVLKLVGLEGFQDRYPHQLSGGQQQRIALARAIAPKPQLLILDEPFSNLDSNLRIQLRNEIFEIIKKTEITAIFVTHDTQDAMAIVDEIIVLKEGRIVQNGTTENLYNSSVNYYVASLFNQLIVLSNLDLDCFGFKNRDNRIFALRLKSLVIETDCEFTLNSKIEKSQFYQGLYLNTIKLESKSYISFYSNKELTDEEVCVGFNSKDLLIFDS